MNFKTTLFAAALPLLLAAPAQAEDLTFTLINRTSQVLTHFHTSPVGVNDWEEDVFGDQVLNPGESIELTIADGRSVCDYDMRFGFEGSKTLDTTVDTQDLCEMGSYTLTE